MAAAQVATEGAWWRLANVGPGNRFDEPTVIGVDFPNVALREARWDPNTSTLTVTPVDINPDTRDRTTFRITTISEPTQWTADGPVATDVHPRAVGAAIEVEMPACDEPVFLHGPARTDSEATINISRGRHGRPESTYLPLGRAWCLGP